MKYFDTIDRKLLYELDRDSRVSFQRIAKTLRISKETARFRILRLVREGYIKNFITTINVSYLNCFYYKFFYKFHKTTPVVDLQIIEFIRNYQSIAYFANLEGKYDITFLILARGMQDLYHFLIPFREKFGSYILEQEILTMPSVQRFNLRFFYGNGELFHTQYPIELSSSKVDLIDYTIIQSLATNSRISLIDIAKMTKTETNVIKYRIKKLRRAKILGTSVLEVNFEKFGLQHFQVNFILKDHSSINQIISYASHFNQSTFATITLGKYDLALEFVVETTKQLRAILNSIKEKFNQEIVDHDVFILEEHSIHWFPYSLIK